jgi:hypothetical protein
MSKCHCTPPGHTSTCPYYDVWIRRMHCETWSDTPRFAGTSSRQRGRQHILQGEKQNTYVALCGIRLRKVNATLVERGHNSIADLCYDCSRVGGIPR